MRQNSRSALGTTTFVALFVGCCMQALCQQAGSTTAPGTEPHKVTSVQKHKDGTVTVTGESPSSYKSPADVAAMPTSNMVKDVALRARSLHGAWQIVSGTTTHLDTHTGARTGSSPAKGDAGLWGGIDIILTVGGSYKCGLSMAGMVTAKGDLQSASGTGTFNDFPNQQRKDSLSIRRSGDGKLSLHLEQWEFIGKVMLNHWQMDATYTRTSPTTFAETMQKYSGTKSR